MVRQECAITCCWLLKWRVKSRKSNYHESQCLLVVMQQLGHVSVFVCVLALFSGDAFPSLVGRDGSAGDGSFGDDEEEEEPDRLLRALCVFCCHLGALGSRLPPQIPLPHLTVML